METTTCILGINIKDLRTTTLDTRVRMILALAPQIGSCNLTELEKFVRARGTMFAWILLVHYLKTVERINEVRTD